VDNYPTIDLYGISDDLPEWNETTFVIGSPQADSISDLGYGLSRRRRQSLSIPARSASVKPMPIVAIIGTELSEQNKIL
jgi:hypothetical protein